MIYVFTPTCGSHDCVSYTACFVAHRQHLLGTAATPADLEQQLEFAHVVQETHKAVQVHV